MSRPFHLLLLCFLSAAAIPAAAASGRVIKVLPQLLDLKGQHTTSPSLYDRDAYQVYLRLHSTNVSGIRFAVEWKASGAATMPLKLRVEFRGAAKGDLPPLTTLEQDVKPGGWFSHWAYLPITGEAYRKVGSVTAWRATLWEGDHQLSEQKSFLW